MRKPTHKFIRLTVAMKELLIILSVAALSLTGNISAQEKQTSESKAKTESAAGSLNDYVGRYGGKKEIFVRDGGLYYQRIGGRGGLMRSIGKDKFAPAHEAEPTF